MDTFIFISLILKWILISHFFLFFLLINVYIIKISKGTCVTLIWWVKKLLRIPKSKQRSEENDAENEDVIEFEVVLHVSEERAKSKKYEDLDNHPDCDIPVGRMDGFEREGGQEEKAD